MAVSRAMKFHHRERMMRNRKFHWGRELSPLHLRMAVNTPKPCSCMGCGNARRACGPTMQERRIAAAEKVID